MAELTHSVSEHLIIEDAHRNYSRNPSFEVDTSDWGASNATIERLSTGGINNGACLKVTITGNFWRVFGGAWAPMINSLPGKGLTAAYVRLDPGNVGTALRFGYFGTNTEGASAYGGLTGSSAISATTTWTRFTNQVSRYNPVRAWSGVYFEYDYVNSVTTIGDIFYIDQASLNPCYDDFPTTYFDGGTTGAHWTGTAHLSASKMPTLVVDKFLAVNLYESMYVHDGRTNLIQNADIESADISMYTTGGAAAVQSITRTTLSPWEGANSLRITTQTGSNEFYVNDDASRRIPARPGEKFTFHVSARSSTPRQMFITANCYDITGANVTGTSGAIITLSDWARYYRNITLPSNQDIHSMSIEISLTGAVLGETHDFDGFVLERGTYNPAWFQSHVASLAIATTPNLTDDTGLTDVVARNLSVNPSFEVSLDGWSGTNCTLTRVAHPNAVAGGYVLRVEATSTSNWTVRTDLHEAIPEQRITASVRSDSVTTTIVRVGVAQQTGGGGSGGTSVEQVVGTSWARYGVSHQSVAGITHTYEYFQSQNGSGGVGAVYYIDAVHITPGGGVIDYIDGSLPGCAWDGQPAISTSRKILSIDLIGAISGTRSAAATISGAGLVIKPISASIVVIAARTSTEIVAHDSGTWLIYHNTRIF